MTEQQAFDFVVRAIIKQGAPSGVATLGGYMCLYRGSNGTKCAVGHMIPDDLYAPEMEGRALFDLTAAFPALNEPFGKARGLLAALQVAHDSAAENHPQSFLAAFKDRARSVAAHHALDPSAAE